MDVGAFRQQVQGNIGEASPRKIVIIIMAILALIIGILAAVIGRNYGDENCNCISVNDAGFRAFSIAMIAIGVPMIVVTTIFFGCGVSLSPINA